MSLQLLINDLQYTNRNLTLKQQKPCGSGIPLSCLAKIPCLYPLNQESQHLLSQDSQHILGQDSQHVLTQDSQHIFSHDF
jgi:hypothetical protein